MWRTLQRAASTLVSMSFRSTRGLTNVDSKSTLHAEACATTVLFFGFGLGFGGGVGAGGEGFGEGFFGFTDEAAGDFDFKAEVGVLGGANQQRRDLVGV